MKTTYLIRLDECIRPAIADLNFHAEWQAWIINRINVPHEARGKGYGTQLLKTILADADAERATLMLGPEASGALSQEALVAWYERYGFTWTRSGAMMERTSQ